MKIKKQKYNCVMLLDDEELDNYINEKMMEGCQFAKKIYKSSSGLKVLEFLQNPDETVMADNTLYPEIIFVDLNMPLMDGFEFIQKLKKIEDPKINACKLVVLTSSFNPVDKKKVMEISGDICFYNKPLTQAILDQI